MSTEVYSKLGFSLTERIEQIKVYEKALNDLYSEQELIDNISRRLSREYGDYEEVQNLANDLECMADDIKSNLDIISKFLNYYNPFY